MCRYTPCDFPGERTCGIATVPDEYSVGGACDRLLICPVCGFDFVHPVGVTVSPAGRSGMRITINADGIHGSQAEVGDRRGVEIVEEYECENGHAFEYRKQFYKGHTFITTAIRLLKGFERETIWRT